MKKVLFAALVACFSVSAFAACADSQQQCVIYKNGGPKARLTFYRFNFANASAIAELVGARSLRWGLRSRRS